MTTEYTCKKCGESCPIEYDDDHIGHPNAFCDNCNDYPAGLYDPYKEERPVCDDIAADYCSDLIDRAKDRMDNL